MHLIASGIEESKGVTNPFQLKVEKRNVVVGKEEEKKQKSHTELDFGMLAAK